MKCSPGTSLTSTLRPVCLALAALAAGGPPCQAQSQPLQVRDEPLHHVMMETARYRVYDVTVAPSAAMQFHEHKADSVAVFLADSEITNEFESGQKTDFVVKSGLASFASASPGKSYIHRVLLRGGAPFRNVTIEFLQPLSPTPPSDGAAPLDPALVFLRESPRGKAYRLALEPEQLVKLPSNASDIFLVCLTDGRLVQMRGSRPNDGVTCVPGAIKLLEQPEAASLKNDGRGRLELTLIAVF